ncbi:Virus X resistance protein-like, coiled-coil domain [Sesbania bispinosa]|nr:Virus X resistance protein-like, coiled-coil domain [Sesbania bispinosa]
MAEAVLQIVLENLNLLVQKELGLFLGFDQDLKRLASLLTTIKATLEDAEEKQFSDRAIKNWLQKLKDAAHVLDDILDECTTEALELEYEGSRERSGVLDWRQTTSIITQPQIYGRDKDKDQIVDFLVGHASDSEDLSVYPIVGLGGLGKTTLAQLIFSHERVVNHFELRIWVCVSEDFSLKRMTKAIIESASGQACEDLDLEPLQRKLMDFLQRKRYLLVLDDVWEDEQENWQRLKSGLTCGGKGASILVTTRLTKVAAIMGTVPPHELSKLSDIDCWELLKQRAFGPNEEERPELVVIGKEIVNKCGGVPLAAMALGSLLRFKREEKEWLYVKESNLWSLQEKLPDNLVRLKALQHLSLEACDSLSSLPPQIGKLTSLRTLSIYVVGKKRGFLLAELGQLNLKGELHIKHLERVKSVMDAKEANISSKHLNKLRLSWGRNEESQLQENVEQILEVLQPHTQQLYSLGIGGYTGAHFPQWMSSPFLKDLTSLELVDCKSCLQLPQLGKLPSLKYLRISNMSHLIYLCEESYDGGVAGGLTALKSLLLENLPNLVRLSREDGVNMFPFLFTLQITKCPNLLGLSFLPSLNDLYIRGKYHQDLPSSIHKLGSIKSLHFLENEEITCFPDGILRNLTSLKILDFHRYPKLELLPTEVINLDALQELYINSCDNIKSLTDEVLQGLHSLKILEIIGCQKFNLSAGFQYLTCLEELAIGSCMEVEGLHEALQHMTTLQSLSLSDLPNLESLPDCLGNLSLLHE